MSDAIMGVRRQARELVDGTIEVKIHIEPRHKAQFHFLFPNIDMPVALAPLTQEASISHAQIETINEPKGGLLSQWLAIRCGEPEFWEFVKAKTNAPAISSAAMCDAEVKLYLNILSKKEIDNIKQAEQRFHEMIRKPYMDWDSVIRK